MPQREENKKKRKEADCSLIALKEFFPLSMNLQLQHVAEELFQPFSPLLPSRVSLPRSSIDWVVPFPPVTAVHGSESSIRVMVLCHSWLLRSQEVPSSDYFKPFQSKSTKH